MCKNYLEYIMELIKIDDDYTELCKVLNDIVFQYDFRYVTDGNRASDGESLRYLYLHSTGMTPDAKHLECTVFEMMAAMANRIEIDIMGDTKNDNPSRWFYEMIYNLGLYGMTNGNVDCESVNNIINTWMHHKYKKNGKGSLFPLNHFDSDQRKLTIWDQMSMYLVENY